MACCTVIMKNVIITVRKFCPRRLPPITELNFGPAILAMLPPIGPEPLHNGPINIGPIEKGSQGLDRNGDIPERPTKPLPPMGRPVGVGAGLPDTVFPAPGSTLEGPIHVGPPKKGPFGDPGITRKTIYILLGIGAIISTCGILLLYIDWGTIIGCFDDFNIISSSFPCIKTQLYPDWSVIGF